ncbi:MAG TPA: hypothetical protein VG456_07520 [Candidatus Sulfopaludibacter sp.]|jgi:hypothetical protein|nr:hypothetical protein [Candidatus Sulfopaludibacter sp.]
MDCKLLILLLGLSLAASGQRGASGRGGFPVDDGPLPPHATTDIARAKADREQNLKDATRLSDLAALVKNDLSETSSFTLSLSTLKNLEEMEKLSKKLHARLKTGDAKPDSVPSGNDAGRRGPGR